PIEERAGDDHHGRDFNGVAHGAGSYSVLRGLFRMRMAKTAFGTSSKVRFTSCCSAVITSSYSPRICVLIGLVSTSSEGCEFRREITSLIGGRKSELSGYRLISTAIRIIKTSCRQ